MDMETVHWLTLLVSILILILVAIPGPWRR